MNAHSVGVTVVMFNEDEEGAKRAFNAAEVLKNREISDFEHSSCETILGSKLGLVRVLRGEHRRL